MSAVEILRVVHLDRAQAILSIVEYPGGATQVIVPVRAIIADALAMGTAALVLSHNHPSGDPTPSRADIAVTRHLAAIVESLGICLHDHVVSGGSASVSFREAGLL